MIITVTVKRSDGVKISEHSMHANNHEMFFYYGPVAPIEDGVLLQGWKLEASVVPIKEIQQENQSQQESP